MNNKTISKIAKAIYKTAAREDLENHLTGKMLMRSYENVMNATDPKDEFQSILSLLNYTYGEAIYESAMNPDETGTEADVNWFLENIRGTFTVDEFKKEMEEEINKAIDDRETEKMNDTEYNAHSPTIMDYDEQDTLPVSRNHDTSPTDYDYNTMIDDLDE